MSDDEASNGRRRFLQAASASAFVLATHSPGIFAGDGKKNERSRSDAKSPARIRRLRLLTSAPLGEMKTFYGEALGLGVDEVSSTELTVHGGGTPITFIHTPDVPKAPFYHFAFNIPENKILAARAWHLERAPIHPVFPRLRDPKMPDDVVHFRNWNAHSIFFQDPAGNVVEYIARHDLNNGTRGGGFGAKDILYASEIAFVVDGVDALAGTLRETYGLPQYKNGSDQFRAIGDEQGLLLVFNRGRNLSVGVGSAREADVFKTDVEIAGATPRRLTLPDFPYTITVR